MSPLRTLVLAGLAIACTGLGGCVSVLPKTKPAQLYRFGGADAAPAAPAAATAAVVARGPISFEVGAATDRILTISGQDAAYVEGARWVAPAPVLFEEALTRAFQAPDAPHMADRGVSSRAPFSLSLDVQSFETRYDHGPEAPPHVLVQVRAAVIRASDRTVVGEQIFSSDQRASDNRVGAIVQAYDAAVHDTLGKLTAWTADKAR